ncbi:DUF2399 domain-containing protein [Streptomyces sp. NPDC056004]|uniref:DUF2399 domain-containing protein n=1 Tax=unclassified Streptomyces TaxID=2593676 RepID=UPI0035DFF5D9
MEARPSRWRKSSRSWTAPSQYPPLSTERLSGTWWDPALQVAMCANGRPAYEEVLLDGLLDDIHFGRPGQAP